MIIRKSLRPQFDSLESKTVMSAGVSTAHVAAAVAHHGHVAVQPAPDTSVSLTGEADGYYTSPQGSPGVGTKYKLTASGTITPIGAAVVTGSFETPGSVRGGKDTGTLTIVGPQGKLKLKLRPPGPIVTSASNAVNSSINPGGPIRGLNPINPGGPIKTGSTATSGGPIILVNDFTYSIVRGTGHYAHDHGLGTVVITTTPGVTGPPGPGIYSATAALETGSGRTTLTFEAGPVPLT